MDHLKHICRGLPPLFGRFKKSGGRVVHPGSERENFMSNENGQTKLKRVLGFNAAYGAAVGLVVSGTAMFSVGNVAGTSGNATFISSAIALIPMMAAAFAFGELTAMIPGGGMIGDYTSPALGKFFSTFAVLVGYVMLIACDGGTQLVMGGLSFEQVANVPQVVVSLVLLALALAVNIFDVGMYGKVEGIVTIAMMLIYVAMAVVGFFGGGAAFGGAQEVVNTGFLPEGGWGTVFGSVGSAIWFFIGFEFACPMAEENKKPYKYIPWGLILGLLSIYVVDNIFVLGAVKYTDMTVLATSAVPQTDASIAMLGSLGGIIMSALTVLASFTTTNAYCAGLPRMLYGLAREGAIPAVFGKVHPKYKVPMAGICATVFLILLTTVYISAVGGTSDIISMFINVACITWLVTYSIAMIDVLVLRKRYPDFPRLWKAPVVWISMPVGMIGAAYAIYTLAYVLPAACVVMAVVAVYIVVWNKAHKMPVNEVVPIEYMVNQVRDRSEYLPVWDEAVVEWMEKRAGK